MGNVATKEISEYDDESMFLCDICNGDHELLFLDSYLREAFRGGRSAARGSQHENMSDEIVPGEDGTI